MIEYLNRNRLKCKGFRYTVAVARETFSPDRLVSWRGRLSSENDTLIMQRSDETRDEFFERAKSFTLE